MKLLDSLPPEALSAAEEDALAIRIQKTKQEDDINKLVLHNMKEGFLYAKRVCRGHIADDELFSLTYSALVRNAKRFRPGMIRFFAFCKAGIRGALSRYWKTLDVVKNASLHETEETFKAPVDASGMKVRRLSEGVPGNRERGVEHEDDDASYVSGLTAQIQNSLAIFAESPVDPDFPSIEIREQMLLVNEAIRGRLTEQERMVIDLVYKDGFSFQEIGNMLSITRSAVLLAHSKALKKIRMDMIRQKRLLVKK